MKGLELFIKELRKCKGKDEESKRINKELAKIQIKFKGNKELNGYQKKKYVCKLVFIFLQGYKCELGLLEAVNLLSSNAYSEKKAGYMFISVVMSEDHEFILLVINALKNDLLSSNSVFQNMALQFIANNTSIKLANSLVDTVVDILFSINSLDSVKQSAVLALLQLLRIKPDYVLSENKIKRFISVLSHYNLGLVTASASLIEFLTERFPSECQVCLKSCIDRLSRIIACSKDDLRDYSYNSIAAPWLTVKLLRILQNFPPVMNISLRARLREILELILEKAYSTENFESYNMQCAVKFEAISLIIHMDFQAQLLSHAFKFLLSALKTKEANFKCIALELMTLMASNVIYLEHLKGQWNAVINFLRSETDIIIKKRAVNMLYIICTVLNVKPIVNEMLLLLKHHRDYMEEVISQIVSLAEQFGSDRQWYFDTVLTLFQICGDKVSDSIYHSLINRVRNDHEIQKYAAKKSFDLLCEEHCPDTVIKITGYILGEFGYLLARDPRSNYKMQFNVLKQKYCVCSAPTKALLLTIFLKFINIYPDLKDKVQLIFKNKHNVQSEDVEIQQRAIEYLKLSEIATRNLLVTVLEEMPSRIQKTHAAAAIKENKLQNFHLNQIENYRRKNLDVFRSHCDYENVLHNSKTTNLSSNNSESHSNIGLGSSSNFNLLMNKFRDSSVFNIVAEALPNTSMPELQISKTVSNESFLLFNKMAKLYDDDVIAIIIESEFKKQCGRFHLKYMNKTDKEFSEISIQVDFANMLNKCIMWFKDIDSTLLPHKIAIQDMHLECLSEFTERPSMNLEFISKGQQHKINLTLPLTLNKFVEPGNMAPEVFVKRWKDFESSNQEVVKEFTAKYPMIYGVTREKLKGFGLSVMEDMDPNCYNFHCAGIFYTRETTQGFLVKLEKYIIPNKYCCRVRSRERCLSQIISDLLFELL